MELMRIEKVEQEMVVDATKNPAVSRRFIFTIHQAVHSTIHTILVLVNIVPFAISLWLMALLAERFARSDLTRVLVVFTAAWGTVSQYLPDYFEQSHSCCEFCIVVTVRSPENSH